MAHTYLNKEFKMNKKKLLAVLAMPIAAIFMLGGVQSSVGAFATGIEGDADTDATTAATADSILQCGWRMTGVDSAITLANSDPELEYTGTDFELQGSDSGLKVFLSGDATESTRCSFYNDYKGAQVKVSWSGDEFVSSRAGVVDTSLSWFVAEKPLLVTYADETCATSWTTNSDLTIASAFAAGSELIPAAILATAVDSTAEYNPAAKTGSTFPSCGFNATYSTAVPSGQTPNSPGATYSFAGPGLTTTLVLEP